MPRIAMVVFSHYPLDVRVRREAEALIEAGMTVDAICIRGSGEAKEERVNQVNIYRVNLKRKRAGKLRYLWEYGYFMVFAFLKLTLLHARYRYKIIHIHNLPDMLVISALFPKLFGAKIILDMHESMPGFYMRKFGRSEEQGIIRIIKFIERISVKFADHIIVAAPFIRDKLIEGSVRPEKCTTILNLPDTNYLNGHTSFSSSKNGTFSLVYPGTLSEIHGVDIAVRAVKLVCQEIPLSIQLHIYGSGSAEETLKVLVKELNLQKAVIFHPIVPLEKLAEILKTMDVGVVPKRNGVFAGEAISTKLFDFAAMGLPTIVSKTKGDSLFFDESMVMFFDPENERQLADCIIKLYRNPELRQMLAVNAKKVVKRMNWGILKKDLYKIYEKLSEETFN